MNLAMHHSTYGNWENPVGDLVLILTSPLFFLAVLIMLRAILGYVIRHSPFGGDTL